MATTQVTTTPLMRYTIAHNIGDYAHEGRCYGPERVCSRDTWVARNKLSLDQSYAVERKAGVTRGRETDARRKVMQ